MTDRSRRRSAPRREKAGHDARGIVGAHHESEQRPKAHCRRWSDEAKSRLRCLEGGVQPWRAFEAPEVGAQVRIEEFQAIDTDVIACAGYDVVDDELAFAAILSAAKAKRDPTVAFASLNHCRLGVNGHLVLDPLAKPPRALGGQVAFHKARSPRRRQLMDGAREPGQRPRLRACAEPRNQGPQASQEAPGL